MQKKKINEICYLLKKIIQNIFFVIRENMCLFLKNAKYMYLLFKKKEEITCYYYHSFAKKYSL
jgi:hypothetical protein